MKNIILRIIDMIFNNVIVFNFLDVNGESINMGDMFTFQLCYKVGCIEELTGCFAYSDEDLRIEIDVFNHDKIICLSYDGYTMTDFELIETEKGGKCG